MINIDLSFPTQLEVTAGSAALVSPAAPGGPRGATRLERSLQVQSLVETWSRMCPGPGPGPGLSPTPCCRETMKKLWWTVANQAPPPTTASRGKCWKVRPRPLLVCLDHSLTSCLAGHRAMLVAVPQRHRGRRHHRRRRDIVHQEGRGSPHHCGSCLVTSDLPADSPSRRVLAILGAANTDQGHTPCQLFTQLDELTVGGGDSPEWKEAAR